MSIGTAIFASVALVVLVGGAAFIYVVHQQKRMMDDFKKRQAEREKRWLRN